MKSTRQLQNKIDDLTWWLQNNPNHPDRVMMEKDKRQAERELAEKENVA